MFIYLSQIYLKVPPSSKVSKQSRNNTWLKKEQQRFFFPQLPSQKSIGSSTDLKEHWSLLLATEIDAQAKQNTLNAIFGCVVPHDTPISDLVMKKLKYSLIPNFHLLSCNRLTNIRKPTRGICSNPWLNKGLFTEYAPATAVMMTKKTLSCSLS